jgi:hypothetical protein
MTNRSMGVLRRRFHPAGGPTTRDEATPSTTRRHLARLRELGSPRRIWMLGPDFRPKTVALRRLG